MGWKWMEWGDTRFSNKRILRGSEVSLNPNMNKLPMCNPKSAKTMVRRCENKFGLNRPSTALTTMGPHLNGLEQHLAPKIQGLGPLRTTITGIDTGTVGEGIQLEMAQKCLP